MFDNDLTASKLRSDIEATKDQISSTVGELGTKLTEMKDWHYMVRTYPLASIGVCLGIGFLAARLLLPNRQTVSVVNPTESTATTSPAKNPITEMIVSSIIGFAVNEGKKAAQNAISSRFSRRASLRDLN